jgi:hypothetical protein
MYIYLIQNFTEIWLTVYDVDVKFFTYDLIEISLCCGTMLLKI